MPREESPSFVSRPVMNEAFLVVSSPLVDGEDLELCWSYEYILLQVFCLIKTSGAPGDVLRTYKLAWTHAEWKLFIEEPGMVWHCMVYRNPRQFTLGSKETERRGLETFMSCDGSDLGENILDLIVELGVNLLGPEMLGKATIRPRVSVVFLIYPPCCWRIHLSSGKYCNSPSE